MFILQGDSMSTSTQESFSKFRALLFPIYTHELKKFLPTALMMFFCLFNYTILRDTKDTLVVNSAGAEALSLLKLFGTVPGALLILLIYSKLSNIFSKKQLFYVMLLPFIAFFTLFAFVIYPNRELFHPAKETITALAEAYPRFKTCFYVYGSWSYGLFYILAELWGSAVISLLFWQFANDITSIKEAKRFYGLFGFIGNIALIVSGLTVQYFSHFRATAAAGVDPWGVTLYYLMSAVAASGILLMITYYAINKFVLKDTLLEPVQTKKKEKLSLKESFSHLIRSKHLGCIALLVIMYGVSINVIEGVWKGQIKEVYTNENTYNAFMGRVSFFTGILTCTFMIIGTNIVRIFGWYRSAILTPILFGVTGLAFFMFVSFKDEFQSWTTALFAMAPAAVAVWIGFFQNILAKSTKYSLFDPTKEMCYIPLDNESKMKGKAAVDVVGGRLGKSGGAFLQQFFLLTTGSTLVGIAPYLSIALFIAVILWIVAAKMLNKSMHSKEELATS